MPNRFPTRADDERLLRMLDLRDYEGMSSGQIAESVGVTRNSVVGQFHRVKTSEVHECACVKRKNKDGGMKRGWWKK